MNKREDFPPDFPSRDEVRGDEQYEYICELVDYIQRKYAESRQFTTRWEPTDSLANVQEAYIAFVEKTDNEGEQYRRRQMFDRWVNRYYGLTPKERNMG